MSPIAEASTSRPQHCFLKFLKETVENHPPDEVPDVDDLVGGLRQALTDPSGGGGDFLSWIGRGHDLVGMNAVAIVTGQLASVVAISPDSSIQPVVQLANGEYTLESRGDGGHWNLDVEVQVVGPGQVVSGNPTLPILTLAEL